MYKKILIPLDNSKTDTVILDHIQPLVRLMGSSLVFVHVADGFGARLQQSLNLEDSQEIKEDRQYLSDIAQRMVSQGFEVKTILVQDKEPVEGILSVALEHGCDLIAMATHGHGPVKDLILGSVADVLRHRTDLPILMLRSPSN